MSLQIKRQKDNRVVKCVLHRVADIPGGVAINVAQLGGDALYEGTPIGKGKTELYEVCKTAQIVGEAGTTNSQYDVAKGHHFKVGDYFAVEGANGQIIKSIDKTNPEKDVIELAATLGIAVHVGNCAYESKGATQDLKIVPSAIAGSNEDVASGENLFVSSWVIAVVNESTAPKVNEVIKTALKTVAYV